MHYIEFCKYLEELGVENIIVTDISKDGTLKGPNLNMLTEIKNNVSISITASGGVKNINDLKRINKLNIYGSIVGKSIYEGTLDLKEAIETIEATY